MCDVTDIWIGGEYLQPAPATAAASRRFKRSSAVQADELSKAWLKSRTRVVRGDLRPLSGPSATASSRKRFLPGALWIFMVEGTRLWLFYRSGPPIVLDGFVGCPLGCAFAPPPIPKFGFLIFASDHDLGVNLWQRLGGPLPLWSTCHNRSDAIHYDPNAHIGAIGNKTSLCACRSDLGAGSLRRRLKVGDSAGADWAGVV